MAHFMNLLSSPCTLRNHFDCDHDMRNDIPRQYLDIGNVSDTAQYLAGFGDVAQLDEDEASMLWLMLEADGAHNDMERGVRDGLLVAFGS